MVQGRLSSEVAGKFQYFPIHNWRSEFFKAKELGFDSKNWFLCKLQNMLQSFAAVVELVDTSDSKSDFERSDGSSPSCGTI